MASHSPLLPHSGQLNAISLCAGYGGLDLGLHIAEPGYRTVCFVEREAHAAAALVARMGDKALDQAPVWDDLKSFDGRPWRGRVHIVAAGYPCQPFSSAGRRTGKNDPRHLWPSVSRIVSEVEPEWVFCENVEGHVTLGLPDVLADLRRLGYRCKAGLFAAAEVGASHRRRRLFILAHADRERCGVHARSVDLLDGEGVPADRLAEDKLRPVPTQPRKPGVDHSMADAEGVRLRDLRGADGPFVPDPDELQEWSELLAVEPGLQPALLREDAGLAGRVDTIRAVGNGVCPLAAAAAWSALKADFYRSMGSR